MNDPSPLGHISVADRPHFKNYLFMRFSFIHVLRGFSWIWADHQDAMTDKRKRKMLLMMPSLKQDKSEKHCINS